ncbi:MAG: stage II sporulation protein P, partial [Negativicutes bacterium]|nr:stage II sporulation protein P [Negativicutes bacterium]
IFIAHGNYNQDLGPRAILVEIGTQYNTLDQAKRSAALFADIVPSLLKPAGGNAANPAAATDEEALPPENNTLADILTILGVIAAGAAAFLFLSTGSWREAKEKLWKFRDVEFGDVFRLRRKRR